jgi:hypothetical protein
MTQLHPLGTKAQIPPQRSIPKYPVCTLEAPLPPRKFQGHWDTMAYPLFDIVTGARRLVLNYCKI